MVTDLQADPAYHEGFFDAQSGEPLFDDASKAYEAGWRAFYASREILERAGFSRTASGYSKTTVLASRPLPTKGDANE